MNVNEAILNRRSVRRFTDKEIPLDDLIKIMEAARWAPTAVNRQKSRFILVTDDELLQKVANNAKIVFYKQKHAAQARAIIVVCLDSTAWVEELGAAIQNILLQAYSLSIGTCWIGAFNREAVREILKIPQNYKLYALILLGYYTEDPDPTPRLELGQIAFLNGWRKPLVKPKGGLLPKSGAMSIFITKRFTDTKTQLKESPLSESEEMGNENE